jgi:hypothetical protein
VHSSPACRPDSQTARQPPLPSLSTISQYPFGHFGPRGPTPARPRRPLHIKDFRVTADRSPDPVVGSGGSVCWRPAPRDKRHPRAAGPGRCDFARLRARILLPTLIPFLLPFLQTPGHRGRDQPFRVFWTARSKSVLTPASADRRRAAATDPATARNGFEMAAQTRRTRISNSSSTPMSSSRSSGVSPPR